MGGNALCGGDLGVRGRCRWCEGFRERAAGQASAGLSGQLSSNFLARAPGSPGLPCSGRETYRLGSRSRVPRTPVPALVPDRLLACPPCRGSRSQRSPFALRQNSCASIVTSCPIALPPMRPRRRPGAPWPSAALSSRPTSSRPVADLVLLIDIHPAAVLARHGPSDRRSLIKPPCSRRIWRGR